MDMSAPTSEAVVDKHEVGADLPPRIPKKRAKVWEYVESEEVDGKEKAICKYCKLHLSNETGKGTSHLNRHIAYHCQDIPQEDRSTFLKTLKQKSAHFVDEKFELQKNIISFKQISFPHNSYAVQDGITSCLMEWDITSKVFSLTLDNAKVNEHFDVLAWWRKNSDAYPVLSIMARDFLAIPVSTVSSESAFSLAGRLLGKNRNSLAPGTLEALVCCKDWFIGFSPEDEGQPIEGKRMFDSEEDDDTEDGWNGYH